VLVQSARVPVLELVRLKGRPALLSGLEALAAERTVPLIGIAEQPRSLRAYLPPPPQRTTAPA